MSNVPPAGATVADVAAAIAAKPSPTAGAAPGVAHVQRSYGVVQSIQTGTVTITLAGSPTQIAGVAYAAHYSPKVNDTVIVDHVGSDLFVNGTKQSGANFNLNQPVVSVGAITAPNFHGVADSATALAGGLSGVVTASGASNVARSLSGTGLKFAVGAQTVTVPANATQVSFTVSLPAGFTGTPYVFITPQESHNYRLVPTVVSGSASSFTATLSQSQSSPMGAGAVLAQWWAIGA